MKKQEKKYKIVPNRNQLKIIKKYWKAFGIVQDDFYKEFGKLEILMEKETGIKGIEFIKDQMFGGDWIGVGNVDRTMKLMQRGDL